jgi:hypothetical protein
MRIVEIFSQGSWQFRDFENTHAVFESRQFKNSDMLKARQYV